MRGEWIVRERREDRTHPGLNFFPLTFLCCSLSSWYEQSGAHFLCSFLCLSFGVLGSATITGQGDLSLQPACNRKNKIDYTHVKGSALSRAASNWYRNSTARDSSARKKHRRTQHLAQPKQCTIHPCRAVIERGRVVEADRVGFDTVQGERVRKTEAKFFGGEWKITSYL